MAVCRPARSALRTTVAALLAPAALVACVAASVAQEAAVPYPDAGYPTATPAPPIPASYADLLPPPDAAPIVPATQADAGLAEAAPVVEASVVEPVAAPSAVDDSITPVAGDAADPPEPVVHWYQPSYWFGPAPWDSGIELGLNGASGTSESISFRTGGFVKREADDYKFDASLYYNKTESEGLEIQSNALLDVRYDWLFDNSPWTLFVMSQTFYDEFQAFDVNLNANAGFGYQWIDTDTMTLTTSVGSGVSREFGGPEDDWVPEASFGFKIERQLAENRKFYAKADWFPEWADFGNYRVLADVGLELELHQPSNVSLKLSATDRYDSNPDGVEPHNLNYSALLIWKM